MNLKNWKKKIERFRLVQREGEITDSLQKVLNQIAYAAWRCADPGTQYDITINEWHTSPKGERIRASNPCSTNMFLNNAYYYNRHL
ncbi:MAG: hypothetical protein QM802_16560 [Agriterribacter sp.]